MQNASATSSSFEARGLVMKTSPVETSTHQGTIAATTP